MPNYTKSIVIRLTWEDSSKYQLACRTTIFCTEMYRNLETPGKAAEQFIKMTSGVSVKQLWIFSS